MLIKVTRSAAVAALLRGETVWSLTTGEGWSFCTPANCSTSHARRFLAKLQKIEYFWDKRTHEWALRK